MKRLAEQRTKDRWCRSSLENVCLVKCSWTVQNIVFTISPPLDWNKAYNSICRYSRTPYKKAGIHYVTSRNETVPKGKVSLTWGTIVLSLFKKNNGQLNHQFPDHVSLTFDREPPLQLRKFRFHTGIALATVFKWPICSNFQKAHTILVVARKLAMIMTCFLSFQAIWTFDTQFICYVFEPRQFVRQSSNCVFQKCSHFHGCVLQFCLI